MDRLAELRCGAAEVEDFDFESGVRHEGLVGDLDQTPGLRHFAGTSVLGARRAIDDEDARRSRRIIVTTFGGFDGVVCVHPIDGDVVVGVGKAGAGLAGDRRLSTVVIGIPGGIGNGLQLALQRRKDGIRERRLEPLLECRALQLAGRHSLADGGLGHGALLMCRAAWPWSISSALGGRRTALICSRDSKARLQNCADA